MHYCVVTSSGLAGMQMPYVCKWNSSKNLRLSIYENIILCPTNLLSEHSKIYVRHANHVNTLQRWTTSTLHICKSSYTWCLALWLPSPKPSKNKHASNACRTHTHTHTKMLTHMNFQITYRMCEYMWVGSVCMLLIRIHHSTRFTIWEYFRTKKHIALGP